MTMKKSIKIFCEIILFILLIFIDQITKYIASVTLKINGPIELIHNTLELRYLENTGAAFGIFENKILFFAIMTLIILIFIIFIKYRINNLLYIRKVNAAIRKKFIFFDIILLILSSGAIGNLIDRLRFNYVVDFIYFKLINFPIFNVADCYVTISAFLLIITFLFVFKENDYGLLFPSSGKSDKERTL